MIRTIKDCLESRIQQRIPAEHAVMSWMTQHAAWILTTRARSSDGKTAYEYLRGEPFSKRMVGFGEVCLAKLDKAALAKDDVPKFAARWTRAVWLGYERDTHEYVFFTQGQILKTRALQRVPTGSRWNPQALQEVTATPRSLYRRPDPDTIFMRDPSIAVEQERKSSTILRDINLRLKDFQEHGFTNTGCPRCAWAIRYGYEHQTTLSLTPRSALSACAKPSARVATQDASASKHQNVAMPLLSTPTWPLF